MFFFIIAQRKTGVNFRRAVSRQTAVKKKKSCRTKKRQENTMEQGEDPEINTGRYFYVW